MPDRNELTAKQLSVLKFIENEFIKTGKTPTYRAIAESFGLKAVGTIQDYISKLIELGFLDRESGRQGGFKMAYQSRTTLIPILGQVPAGRPMEAIESLRGSLALTGNWRGDFFALRVTGESMKERGILDGDFVVIKKQGDAENGEIVVASVNQEATVKILEKKNGKVRLIPANSAFKPIELSEEGENRIVGKVVAVQRVY